MDIPNADPCWNVRKGVRMQLGPMGKCALKRTKAGCACKDVVESATKAIGVSKLEKEQGLAACSFVRVNGVFRFATDGLYGKSYLFCPPSTSF